MDWNEVNRRIQAGEDVQAVLDERSLAERDEFVAFLRSEGHEDAAEKHLALCREIDSGVYGARNCWHALSRAQRDALLIANKVGGKLDRIGNGYRWTADRPWGRPIRVATIRNLCSRDLLAWDGGAFDPEAVVVVTERGRFVLKHGPAA